MWLQIGDLFFVFTNSLTHGFKREISSIGIFPIPTFNIEHGYERNGRSTMYHPYIAHICIYIYIHQSMRSYYTHPGFIVWRMPHFCVFLLCFVALFLGEGGGVLLNDNTAARYLSFSLCACHRSRDEVGTDKLRWCEVKTHQLQVTHPRNWKLFHYMGWINT